MLNKEVVEAALRLRAATKKTNIVRIYKPDYINRIMRCSNENYQIMRERRNQLLVPTELIK